MPWKKQSVCSQTSIFVLQFLFMSWLSIFTLSSTFLHIVLHLSSCCPLPFLVLSSTFLHVVLYLSSNCPLPFFMLSSTFLWIQTPPPHVVLYLSLSSTFLNIVFHLSSRCPPPFFTLSSNFSSHCPPPFFSLSSTFLHISVACLIFMQENFSEAFEAKWSWMQ